MEVNEEIIVDQEYVLPVEAVEVVREEEEPSQILLRPKNQILQIVTTRSINPDNFHKLGSILFSSTEGSENSRNKIEELANNGNKFYFVREGNRLFLHTDPDRSEIKKVSPWKGLSAYVYTKPLIEIDAGSEHLLKLFDEHYMSSGKVFEYSQITLAWSYDEEARISAVEFYLSKDAIFENIASAHRGISSLCKQNVPYVLNKMLLISSRDNAPNILWNHQALAHENTARTEVDTDFDFFFNEIEQRAEAGDWCRPKYEVNINSLHCKLMPYQMDTVRWMIDRETKPELEYGRMLDSWRTGANCFYWPAYGVYTRTNDYQKSDIEVRGGILADEMGLGKTIEILALISTRKKNREVDVLERDENEGDRMEKHEKEYANWIPPVRMVNQATTSKFQEYENAKRVDKSHGTAVIFTEMDVELKESRARAGNVVNKDTMIKCTKCQIDCVAEKCGWSPEFAAFGPFFCPLCMADEPPLPVNATLVIMPESLVIQWFNEISKHCSDLKVMFYFGLNKSGYFHPREIAKYDIILTTYETLRFELDFVNPVTKIDRKLRAGNQSHKFSPTSFTHVVWWRMVVDESQLVEGSARKVPKMCASMRTINKWCVTGTPLVKSVSDIHGLLQFLNVWPLSIEGFWSRYAYPVYKLWASERKSGHDYCNFDDNVLMCILPQIFRRNTKFSVQRQMKLPELDEVTKKCRFTVVEERQYKEEKEKLAKTVERLIGTQPDNMKISSLNSRERIMGALRKLRETLISCGEHVNFCERKFAVKKHLHEQIIYGPDIVMLRLIRKKKAEIEEKMRVAVSSLFACAGCDCLNGDFLEALKSYEKVFKVIEVAASADQHLRNVMDSNSEGIENEDSDYEKNDDEENGQICAHHQLIKNEKRERIKKQTRLNVELNGIKFNRKRLFDRKHRKLAEAQKDGKNNEITPGSKRKRVRKYESGAKKARILNGEEGDDERIESDEEEDIEGDISESESEVGNEEEGEEAAELSKNEEKINEKANDKEEEPGCSTSVEQETERETEREQDKKEAEDDFEKQQALLEETRAATKMSLERKAARPLRIDPTMRSHLVMNMREIAQIAEAEKEVEAMIEKYGGDSVENGKEKFLKDQLESVARYCRVEIAGLQVITDEWEIWKEEWEEAGDESGRVIEYLEDLCESYKAKQSLGKREKVADLGERVFLSGFVKPLMQKMPFVPIYSQPRKQITSGTIQLTAVQKKLKMKEEAAREAAIGELKDEQEVLAMKIRNAEADRQSRLTSHVIKNCMGLCNRRTYEDVYWNEKRATTVEMLETTKKHLQKIETARRELFEEFEDLMNAFHENRRKVPHDNFFELSDMISYLFTDNDEQQHFRNVCSCDHFQLLCERDLAVSNETDYKCKICKLYCSIAKIRFETGLGSYHGDGFQKSAIPSFLGLIAGFEKRMNPAKNAQMEGLRGYREYIGRIQKSLQIFNAAINVVWELGNRMKELEQSTKRLTVAQLKSKPSSNVAGSQAFSQMLIKSNRDKFEREYTQENVDTAKKIHDLRYLVFLYGNLTGRNKDGEHDFICPVCQTEMEAMVIFPCGHRVCEGCYTNLKASRFGSDLSCVSCRKIFAPNNVMIAMNSSASQISAIPGITLAIKMNSTIVLMQKILNENPTNKILLFTTMETCTPIWRFVNKVLEKAKIPFIEVLRKDYGKRIHRFETDEMSRVLLCSLQMCANGLNLTKANHVIFLDPPHLSSVVSQAIGRISRYGQKRKMHAYHMLVESSIDEDLRNMSMKVVNDKPKKHWTVGDVRQVFSLVDYIEEQEPLDFGGDDSDQDGNDDDDDVLGRLPMVQIPRFIP